ncbi:hypothetical protein GW17_00014782 [Ensete ventricosum]|nr:hypothetical protein GW17_00014782 [Ensete ventricosum]
MIAQGWYSRLPPASIHSFDQLAREFEVNFLASARPKPTVVSLLGMSIVGSVDGKPVDELGHDLMLDYGADLQLGQLRAAQGARQVQLMEEPTVKVLRIDS